MKVSELLETRKENWRELESMCNQMSGRRKKTLGPDRISRFTVLYRAACADLALADAYQLPPNMVQYLHRLVGRAHNQLYRGRYFDVGKWMRVLFVETPQVIFNDRSVQFVFCLFWSMFLGSAFLAYHNDLWPGFANEIVGDQQLEGAVEMFTEFDERPWETNLQMASFYIWHNAGIGLQCFAESILVIPGLLTITSNAVQLGTIFGYMFRPDTGEAGEHFKNFVTAHGPFELTAIVLSGGAGLKIGMSWLRTNGLSRTSSIVKAGREAMPIAAAAFVLFCMAALIEGFISPTTIPWAFKAFVAVVSSLMLTFYFVFLGFPRQWADF